MPRCVPADNSHVRQATRRLTVASLVVLSACLGACGFIRVGRSRSIQQPARSSEILPVLEGGPVGAKPLVSDDLPMHPFMAKHGTSCMHADAATTNTHPGPGPLGNELAVESRSMGFLGGECPTINFDGQGRIITVCVRDRRPSLLLLDATTLRVLASHALPRRRTPLLRLRKMMEDTSGGAYFYLDQLGRAVVGTAKGTIEVISVVNDADNTPHFVVDRSIDLRTALLLPEGGLDKLTAVLPDFEGNYWFSARAGTVGVVLNGGQIRVHHLDGEELQNAFSLAKDGVYVVSDHALYRFAANHDGPYVVWREIYDRGTHRKVGQINRGSGTTPTLLGDDYVAIADNAEPRMQVRVYRRVAELGGPELGGPRLVCTMPVFEAGASATENTMIGHGRSLIIENNAGYDIFRTMRGGKTSSPGLARIDIRENGKGCDIVWESREISQTAVPKLSAATGLIYLYTKRPDTQGVDAYYFTAIDFETGLTRYRVLTGTGVRYDNNWASISLGPDGSAYVGVLNGLVRVRDSVTTVTD